MTVLYHSGYVDCGPRAIHPMAEESGPVLRAAKVIPVFRGFSLAAAGRWVMMRVLTLHSHRRGNPRDGAHPYPLPPLNLTHRPEGLPPSLDTNHSESIFGEDSAS